MKHWSSEIFEYGLKDEKLFHIKAVENGLKCNCICPSCGQFLIAVNNIKCNKLRPYFRHYINICNPKEYYETVVHYLAKQVIEEESYIPLPKFEFQFSSEMKSYLTNIDIETFTDIYNLPSCLVPKITSFDLFFKSIKVEKKRNQIIPDIQINYSEKTLLVEIAYTHKVDENKLRKIENDKLDIIEIDLSKLRKNSTKIEIKNSIYPKNYLTKWLNNEKLKNLLKKKMEFAITLRDFIWNNCNEFNTYSNLKKIYNCPIKNELTNNDFVLIEKDCKNCKFYLDIQKTTNYDKEHYNMEKDFLIENGEPTDFLAEKYGEKIYFENGKLSCGFNLKNDFENKITAANMGFGKSWA